MTLIGKRSEAIREHSPTPPKLFETTGRCGLFAAGEARGSKERRGDERRILRLRARQVHADPGGGRRVIAARGYALEEPDCQLPDSSFKDEWRLGNHTSSTTTRSQRLAVLFCGGCLPSM